MFYSRHHLDEKTGHLTHKKTGKSKIIGQAKRQDFKKNQRRAPTGFKNYDIQTTFINLFFDEKYNQYIGKYDSLQ